MISGTWNAIYSIPADSLVRGKMWYLGCPGYCHIYLWNQELQLHHYSSGHFLDIHCEVHQCLSWDGVSHLRGERLPTEHSWSQKEKCNYRMITCLEVWWRMIFCLVLLPEIIKLWSCHFSYLISVQTFISVSGTPTVVVMGFGCEGRCSHFAPLLRKTGVWYVQLWPASSSH